MDTIQDHLIILRDGKVDTANGTSPQTMDNMFAQLRTALPKKIVIHFHGGLVDRAAGIGAATAVKPGYEAAGAHPLFFIWESGWREVLEQKLPSIFQEDIFKNILTRVTQFAKAKVDKATETGTSMGIDDLPLPKETPIRTELKVPSDGQEPFADVDPSVIPESDELTDDERKMFIEKMKNDTSLEVIGQKVANSVQTPEEEAGQGTAKAATIRGATETLMDPDVLREITNVGDAEKGEARSVFSAATLAARAAQVLERVISRFARRRDHGFYLTIVEEILRGFYVGNAGKFMWDGMKSDIVDAFGSTADCGGAQFLACLQKVWTDPAAWSPAAKPVLTLVGHSAGAIYACNFLKEVEARKLPADVKFNLILIAPACTFGVLADALKAAGNRVAALRVFGMSDELERKNALVPAVPLLYPSSLLYFVSGILEDESDTPLVGMARFWEGIYTNGKFPEIDYVVNGDFFKPKTSRIWALSSGGNGLNCDMSTHGGWAQAPETLKSVQYILSKGYGDAAAAG